MMQRERRGEGDGIVFSNREKKAKKRKEHQLKNS
jgi:hypothetical protein